MANIDPGMGQGNSAPPTQDLGLGLVGPEWFETPFDSPDLPYLVTLRASFSGDRYEVAELKCERRQGGVPVTGEGVRQLPIGELLTYAVVAHVGAYNGEVFRNSPVRPQIGDDETLVYVARLYWSAYVAQEDPAIAVMQNLNLPRATAGRWIKRARERGFLSDAAPHRPKGEAK